MRLLLIRHGHSQHSERKVMAGVKGCTGLSARGRLQADAVAARLQEAGLDDPVLLASPVSRARETAGIVGEKLGLPVEEAPWLSSFDPGEADGLPHADYDRKYGYFDLADFPDRPISPGGDSWNSLAARVSEGIHQAAARYNGRTLLRSLTAKSS